MTSLKSMPGKGIFDAPSPPDVPMGPSQKHVLYGLVANKASIAALEWVYNNVLCDNDHITVVTALNPSLMLIGAETYDEEQKVLALHHKLKQEMQNNYTKIIHFHSEIIHGDPKDLLVNLVFSALDQVNSWPG